jgi:riboflavin kinase/FMN adenylyltransferase
MVSVISDALLFSNARSVNDSGPIHVLLKIHQDINFDLKIVRPIVTTGTFDGVHLGHQKILKRLCDIAADVDGESVLFSFYPHPRMVLYPNDHGLRLLSTRAEKHAALEEAGIDHLVEVPFTKEFAGQSAQEYIEQTFVNGIGVHTMVIGYDHRFGRSREGDINTLRELADLYDFEVYEIPVHMMDAVHVSSTKIRSYLEAGKVDAAANSLGRLYELSGTVVAGNRIGRTIGFPTANIRVDDPHKLIPGAGVYAVDVLFEGALYPGMMNIGFRPTVSKEPSVLVLEVHILGLNKDIYGAAITVRFKERIRKEMLFDSLEDLKEQLEKDLSVVSGLRN